MSEQRYKVTLTLNVEDLTREGGKDTGNSAVLVNNEVSARTRNEMQKELMALLGKWGDSYLGKSGN